MTTQHVLQVACLSALLTVASGAYAQTHGHTSPYAGQQNRTITSLSAEDQAALAAGQGWGLAKPAELNGVPGPAHLLELAQKIGLSADQMEKLKQLYAQMREQAIALGHEYMQAERSLDDYFKASQFSDAQLRAKVDQASQALANLRYLHLSYHHRALSVVTPEQVQRYNELRGYAKIKDDPCSQVPSGHDPEMYRKHMGCKP